MENNTIELLHLDAIKRATKDTLYKVQPSIEYSLCYTHAGVTKQIAIEFAKWCDDTDLSNNYMTWEDWFDEFLKLTSVTKLPDLTWKDASEEEIKSKELKSMKGKRL